MQILGFDPVIVTVVICVIGVLCRIIMGMAGKSLREFSPILAFSTFTVSILAAIGLVGPIINVLPEDMDSNMQLVAIAGQILVVMGIDGTVRKVHKIYENTTKVDLDPFKISKPIDDPSDLPPGKEVK